MRAFSPLDERWGLGESVYSPGRAKQMVWLASCMSYASAAEAFERVSRRSVPRCAIWTETQRHGARFQRHLEKQQQQVGVERVVLAPPGLDHERPLGVSLDGGKMNIRSEGWKEFKVGTVYDLELRPKRDAETGEWDDEVHGVHMTYGAVLGNVAEFTPAMWALAVERQVPQAAEVTVTADGAPWIWALVEDLFPDSTQVVDWYTCLNCAAGAGHATEHLAQAAEALYPNDEQQAHQWQRARREDLYLGHTWVISQPLRQAGLATEAGYFEEHTRRMQYQEFHEEGRPIGSGTVESGIKRFKNRISGPGMRWSRPAAERMLALRAAVMSNSFDELWASAN